MSRENARVSGRFSRKSALLMAAAVALPTVVGLQWASAQNVVTWDADGLATPGVVDGLGTWDITTANFWDGIANAPWDNNANNVAVFGAGTTGGAITLGVPVTAGGLTFNNSGYIIGTTATATLTLAGATPTVTLASGVTAGLNAPVAGTTAVTYNVGTGATLNIGSFVNAGNTGGQILTGGGTINVGTTGTFNNGAGTLSGISLVMGNNRGINNGFYVTPGTTNAIIQTGNGTYNGALSGTGTVALGTGTSGLTLTVSGNNSAFAGTFTFPTQGAIIRYTSSTLGGSPLATFDMGTLGTTLTRTQANPVIQMGALKGEAGASLQGSNNTSGTTTYEIGGANLDTVYNGEIRNGTDLVNRRTGVRKVGTGKLTLGGVNPYTGPTTINGGTLALGAAGTIAGSTGINVGSGTSVFDISAVPGGYTVPAGQTISGNDGRVVGDVILANPTGLINPGTNASGIGTAGTLNFDNSLKLTSGTVNFDLSNTTTIGGGVNDLLKVGTLDVSGLSKLIVSPIGTLTTGTYRLIDYTTAVGSLGLLSVASTAPLNASLDTSIAGQINLIVNALGNPQNLRWNGPGADWDLSTSQNFFNTDNNIGTVFFQGDGVTFDDTAGVPTTITLSGVLSPGTVTVNSNTNNFTFNGTGAITGATKLVKKGTSTLIINTANTFSGGVTVEAGTVQVGNSTGLGTFATALNGGNVVVSGGITVTNTMNINNTASGIGGNGSFSGAINVNVSSFKGLIGATNQTLSLSNNTNFVFPFGPATMDFGNSIGTLRFAATTSPQGIGGNLIVDLGTASLTMNTRDGNTVANTFSLAGLSGGTNTIVRGATNTNTASNFGIGGVDITTVFNGSILNGTAGASAGVNLTKLPLGTLVLNGNSTTTGTVLINDQGTLIVNGSYSGGGAFTVDGTLGGLGVIAGPATINSRVAPGNGNGSVGALAVGAATLNNAQLDIELGGGNADRLSASGALAVSGTTSVNLSDAGGATPGRYVVVDYSGTALADLNTWNLNGSSIAGSTAVLANNTINTSVDVVVPNPSAATSEWSNASGGDFATGGNWTAGTPSGIDSVANFGTTVNGAAISLNAAQTLGFASFNASSAYNISGSGSLLLDVTGGYTGMTVVSGGHTVAVPVTASDEAIFAINTGATLTLGSLTATGKQVTKSGGGQLNVTSVQAGSLSVSAGAMQVSVKGSPNSAAGTSVVSSLSIATGASLDLTDNALVLDYTTLGSNLTTIRSHLAAGRISSSSATGGFAVGYADAASVGRSGFAGASLDGTAIIAGLLYAGDANFDGKVNTVDFNQLAGGFGGTNQLWINGDFSYDGLIDSTDFNALVGNFGASMSLPGPSLSPSLGAVVPEPASLSLAAIALGLAGRRRR